MEAVLNHYGSLKAALNSEAYEEAGEHMDQLNQSLRQLFAAPPQFSESELQKLSEISEFLSTSCDKMIVNQMKIKSELASFSTAKKMKKAYGK
ncbi:hypothetical protein [Colwellia sp. MEBiC06753]